MEPIKIKFEDEVVDFDGSCPQCGSEMWDNRAKKKGKKISYKAPDWKCKAPECGFALWPSAIVKEKTPVPKINHNHGAINTDAMLLSYAKDIVIAEIENKYEFPALQEGMLPVDAVLTEVERIYKFLQKTLTDTSERDDKSEKD
ncbi:MAG: hypothetical protein ACOZAL_00095 [Patescibacteria group bacterium]